MTTSHSEPRTMVPIEEYMGNHGFFPYARSADRNWCNFINDTCNACVEFKIDKHGDTTFRVQGFLHATMLSIESPWLSHDWGASRNTFLWKHVDEIHVIVALYNAHISSQGNIKSNGGDKWLKNQ